MLDLLESETIVPFPSRLSQSAAPVIYLISLSQNQYALVDAADYPAVSQYKWYAKYYKSIGGFYAQRNYYVFLPDGRRIRTIQTLHRFIMGLKYGDRLRYVDHIRRHETLNNCRSNLRICTPAQSARNRSMHRDNRLGIKGIRKTKSGKYNVRLCTDYKVECLGTYDTPQEASAVYCANVLAKHAEYASPD